MSKSEGQIPLRHVTLCLPLRDASLLLAMKKRGFGMGRWNGMGGKPQEGESIENAAVRELHEEVGILANVADLERCATLDFFFEGKDEWNQRVHVFLVRSWQGEPAESEEMRPQWFPQSDIPYDTMWPDDRHWLPIVLRGSSVEAMFLLDSTGGTILRHELTEKPRSA